MAKTDIQIIIEAKNTANAELKSLNAELGRTQGHLNTTSGTADKTVGSMGRLGGSFNKANLGAIAAGAGMFGLAAGVGMAGKAAISAGINYETAFAGVEKTVEGTAAELDVLSTAIRQMATEMPIAATEIAGLAEAAGALGVKKEDILEFVRVTALIGTTTDVSSDQAATSLGQLSNVLGLTNDDYEKFGSTLVDLGNKGASTESQILGITERVGAAAELLGFATEETLAWGSAVANLGIEVQAGGTALQTFFISTAKMVAETGDELDILAETAGMTADAFEQAYAQDASAALQTVITGLGELDQAQQLAVLSALGFEDVRITRTLLGLASNTDNLTNSLNVSKDAWQENSAMAIEAEKRFETTASNIQVMKNNLNDLAIGFMDSFGPAINAGIEDVTDFIQVLSLIPKSVDVVVNLVRNPVDTFFAFDKWTHDFAEEQKGGNPVDAVIGGLVSGDVIGQFRDAGQQGGEAYRVSMEDAMQFDPAKMGPFLDSMFTPDASMMGPFLDEIFIGPILALRPEVTAHLKELFTLDPSVGAEFAGSIAEAINSGAMSMEEGLDLLSGLPKEILTPALEDVRRDIIRTLGEEGLGNNLIHEPLQRSLEIVNQLLGDTGNSLSSAGQGFTEFGNAAEMAFAGAIPVIEDLTGAFGNFGAIQDVFLQNISNAGEGVSEWQGHLSGAEQAIGLLQDKQDRGIELSAEEQEQLETLNWLRERSIGGIDDEAAAVVESNVAFADFVKLQDEATQALKDHKISQEEYDQIIAEAAGGLDPLIAGQVSLAGVMETVIEKMRDFMVEIGLIPEEASTEVSTPGLDGSTQLVDGFGGELEELPDEVTTELLADIASAEEDRNRLVEMYDTIPTPDPTVITADTADAYMSVNEFVGLQDQITPSVDTSISADISAAVGALESLIAMATTTRVMPVQISSQIGFTAATGGTINESGIGLVGEEGPELVFLPKGTEVITAPESAAMLRDMPWLGGYAEGTEGAPELTGADRAALQILGDLYVVLDPASVAEAEAELASLWDSRAIAESLGLGEAVLADLDEQIAAKQAELDLIGRAAGTSIGQGITSSIEAEIAKADFAAAQEAMFDAANAEADALFERYGAALSEGAAGQIDRMAEQLSEMDAAIQMAVAGGASEGALQVMQAARIALQIEMDMLIEDMQVATAAGLIPAVEEIAQISLDGVAAIFEEAPEIAGQFVDDIVLGLSEGTFDMEQAFGLLGQIASDELIPALEDIERQLTVDLVQSIIDGNTELEADILEKLRLLGLLVDELGVATGAVDEFGHIMSPGGGWISGEQPGAGGGGSSGGGSSFGGGGGGSSGGGGYDNANGSSAGTGAPPAGLSSSDSEAEWLAVAQTQPNPSAIMSMYYGGILEKYGLSFWNLSGSNPDKLRQQVDALFMGNPKLVNNTELMRSLDWWNYPPPSWITRDNPAIPGYEKMPGNSAFTPMAMGGVIDQPLLALMGEAGREAVVPLEGRGAQQVAEALVVAMREGGVGGSGQVIVIDSPIILDSREIGRFSRQIMLDDYRRTL